MLGAVLIVILVLALLGALPRWSTRGCRTGRDRSVGARFKCAREPGASGF
ncbi:MAG: DUF3309 family protein [Acidobacteriia bacterium]|nr:DUF3309 family protein [Terriglobia bacterium]